MRERGQMSNIDLVRRERESAKRSVFQNAGDYTLFVPQAGRMEPKPQVGTMIQEQQHNVMNQFNLAGAQSSGVTRRDFMKMAIATGVVAAAGPRVWAAEGQ